MVIKIGSYEKEKDKSNWMQGSKEWQEEIRKDFSEQWKEIEENNRIGKIRNLFKKIGDTKEIFHEEMNKIKDRNDKD